MRVTNVQVIVTLVFHYLIFYFQRSSFMCTPSDNERIKKLICDKFTPMHRSPFSQKANQHLPTLTKGNLTMKDWRTTNSRPNRTPSPNKTDSYLNNSCWVTRNKSSHLDQSDQNTFNHRLRQHQRFDTDRGHHEFANQVPIPNSHYLISSRLRNNQSEYLTKFSKGHKLYKYNQQLTNIIHSSFQSAQPNSSQVGASSEFQPRSSVTFHHNPNLHGRQLVNRIGSKLVQLSRGNSMEIDINSSTLGIAQVNHNVASEEAQFQSNEEDRCDQEQLRISSYITAIADQHTLKPNDGKLGTVLSTRVNQTNQQAQPSNDLKTSCLRKSHHRTRSFNRVGKVPMQALLTDIKENKQPGIEQPERRLTSKMDAQSVHFDSRRPSMNTLLPPSVSQTFASSPKENSENEQKDKIYQPVRRHLSKLSSSEIMRDPISPKCRHTLEKAQKLVQDELLGKHPAAPIDYPVNSLLKIERFISLFTSSTSVMKENNEIQQELLKMFRDDCIGDQVSRVQPSDAQRSVMNARIRCRLNHKKIITIKCK